MNVFAALAVLALLILVHETGHFLAAILQGIRVSGFSIGFGPALLRLQRNEITYAIRVLPLGGFVSFPDEDKGTKIPSDDKDLLNNRPIPQRALVISAGILANLLLAIVVLFVNVALVGIPTEPEPGVLVVNVQSGGAAALSGMQSGDRILAIENELLSAGKEGIKEIVKQIKNSPKKKLTIYRQRGELKERIKIEPTDVDGQGRIGAQLQANLTSITRPIKGPFELINYTGTEFIQLTEQTISGYAGLITNFKTTASQVSGPVKIVELGAQLSKQGGSGLVYFTALISINLAVLNSIPLPLLDGGQMMMLIIEAIRGRPLSEQLQLAYAQSGFLLLVCLTVVLIVKDTSQLQIVQQLIGR